MAGSSPAMTKRKLLQSRKLGCPSPHKQEKRYRGNNRRGLPAIRLKPALEYADAAAAAEREDEFQLPGRAVEHAPPAHEMCGIG